MKIFLLFALVLAVASATMSPKNSRLRYRKRSCTSPFANVNNGSMECSDGFQRNSVCRFWCKPGHILKGSSARRCISGRFQWTGRPAICLPVSCDVSEKPRNGRMRCSDENKYTSVCQFKCRANAGYELIGSKERVCQKDGKWSGTRPVCLLIK